MNKYGSVIFLLFFSAVVLSAEEISGPADNKRTAEIAEEKQSYSLKFTFVPVTSLDAVSNDEMSKVMAQFLAEDALSSFLKKDIAVDFSNIKIKLEKTESGFCNVNCEIPKKAISEAKVQEKVIAANQISRIVSTQSQKDSLRDFRSRCFYDLRIAEVLFLEKLKQNNSDKKELAEEINKSFAELNRKIDQDDALFLAEKKELQSKTEQTRLFLLSQAAPAKPLEPPLTDEMKENKQFISEFKVNAPFDKYILSNKPLLTIGGCRGFESENGSLYLIAVGSALVAGNSPQDEIDQKENAELSAYSELTKYTNVSVTYFSAQTKDSVSDGKGNIKVDRKKRKKMTIYSGTYLNCLETVGSWYSKDGKTFFLAKGKKITKK